MIVIKSLRKLGVNMSQIEDIIYIPRISVQAFCESAEVSSLIQAVAADRRADKVKFRLQMGGIEAALEIYRESPTPNLIIIESDNKKGTLPDHLAQLSEFCDENTKVLVVGRVNDIMLYRRLIELGVSDYLILPMPSTELVKAIGRIYAPTEGKKLGRIIAVTGAKGGVGASTIAHNLGFTFSRELQRATCLVDFDFAFGTLGLDFNQDILQGTADALGSADRVDAALIDRLMVKQTDMLSLLGTPASLARSYDYSVEQCDNFLEALRNASPNIIFDMPKAWSGWAKQALVQADDILIVAEPDLANLRNLKNMYDTFRALRPNDKLPQYVINNSGVPKRPEIKLTDFARAVESEPLAVFTHDPVLFGTAANNGQMLAEVDPANANLNAMLTLAKILGNQQEIVRTTEKSGLMAQLAPFKDKWAKLTGKA
jgi:pilus assembly protein CpaE